MVDPATGLAVVDSSPLILLGRTGHLDLLRIAGHILVPEAVLAEVGAKPEPWMTPGDRLLGLPLERAEGGTPDLDVRQWGLGRGETAVLQLARERHALALLDDRRARAAARSLGIGILGTLGLVLRAKLRGAVPLVRPVVDDLLGAGMFVSPGVRLEILRLADE